MIIRGEPHNFVVWSCSSGVADGATVLMSMLVLHIHKTLAIQTSVAQAILQLRFQSVNQEVIVTTLKEHNVV